MQEGVKCMPLPTSFLPPPATVFKTVKHTSSLHVFCFSFVPGDTNMIYYLTINK